MASLVTDTSLTQQATALAKEYGLQLMTPALVTVGELEQIGIDLLEKVKALRESNQSTGETKEVVVDSCPEGALRVEAGLNSFSNAVKEAKTKGITDIFLESGLHDEHGRRVLIDFALKVVGQNKDDVKIRATLFIKGEEEEDVFFSDCTVTGANRIGVWGKQGAAMHLKNVCVEKCGWSGVVVHSTSRNTMTDCNVNNNRFSGVEVCDGGCMTIDGSATTIHHNVTGGHQMNKNYGNCLPSSRSYGLEALDSSSSIHLKSLTKESISTNNGGGGNYGGQGTIKTIGTIQ